MLTVRAWMSTYNNQIGDKVQIEKLILDYEWARGTGVRSTAIRQRDS